jgi:hypothetical protein
MSMARSVTLSLALVAAASTACSVIADEIVGRQTLSDRTFYTLLAATAVLWGVFAVMSVRDYVVRAVLRKVSENWMADRKLAQDYMIQLGMISNSTGPQCSRSRTKRQKRDGEVTPLRQR